jgi:hypothetical protein
MTGYKDLDRMATRYSFDPFRLASIFSQIYAQFSTCYLNIGFLDHLDEKTLGQHAYEGKYIPGSYEE